MSISSCPSDQDKYRSDRETELYTSIKSLVKQIATGMCIPTGMSGQFDIAFKVDRQKIVAKVFREIGEELEKEC